MMIILRISFQTGESIFEIIWDQTVITLQRRNSDSRSRNEQEDGRAGCFHLARRLAKLQISYKRWRHIVHARRWQTTKELYECVDL